MTETVVTQLKPSEVLNQAWELLVPKGRWIQNSWIRDDYADQTDARTYHACSMGAMLLVEHLAGVTGLGLPSERDSDDSDSENWFSPELTDYESAIENLIDHDEAFRLAVRYLADAVVTHITENTVGWVATEDDDEEPWDFTYVKELVHAGDLVEAITTFNDASKTRAIDIDKVFQLAYRTAQAAETA
jgi:hypothetical protein